MTTTTTPEGALAAHEAEHQILLKLTVTKWIANAPIHERLQNAINDWQTGSHKAAIIKMRHYGWSEVADQMEKVLELSKLSGKPAHAPKPQVTMHGPRRGLAQ